MHLFFASAFNTASSKAGLFRAAAKSLIQDVLCGCGRRQIDGFTLDVREGREFFKGIMESIDHWDVNRP